MEYTRKAQPELAERQYEIAVREAAKGDRVSYGHVLDLAAAFFHELGNFPRAESSLRKSLNIWSSVHGRDSIALIPVVNRLACIYIESGQAGKAERLRLEDWVSRVEQQNPASADHVNLLGTLATLRAQRGRYAEAEQYSQNALSMLEKRGEGNSMDSVAMVNNLGLVSLEAGKLDQARKYLRQADDLLRKSPTGHSFYRAVNLTLTARIHIKEKNYADAEKLLKEAIALMEYRCGPESLRTGMLLVEYAGMLREQKRKSEAVQVENRARSIIQGSGITAFTSGVDVGDLQARGSRR